MRPGIYRALSALLFLAVCAGGARGELKITGALAAPAYKIVRLAAAGAQEGAAYVWDVSDEEKLDLEEASGRLLLTGPPGVYKVKLRAIRLDKDGKTSIETARATVTIGDPPPPVPPGPTPPGPTPPGPVSGLRVLVTYESAELSKLPPAQDLVLRAKEVRDYLNAKCVMGPDGKTREWRIWDKDTDAAQESKLWQDALAAARAKPTPRLVVMDGARVLLDAPLPATVAETMATLKRYGG